MKFGKDLQEGIEEKWNSWGEYAIQYTNLKKLLPASPLRKSGEGRQNDDDDDDDETVMQNHFVGGGSSIHGKREALFWKLYTESLEAIDKFYHDKVLWFTNELMDLQDRLEALLQSPSLNIENSNDAKMILGIKEKLIRLQYESISLLEFIEINRTACRKILKKFDKRNVSSLLTIKMTELRETHPFLYGGGSMSGIKNSIEAMLKRIGAQELNIATPEEIPTFQKLPRKILKKARNLLNEMDDSPMFSSAKVRQNALFAREEIEVGPILGTGKFGVVHEIKAFYVNDICPICFLHQKMDDRQRSQPVEQCVEIRSHEQKNPLSSSDNGFRLIDDESTKHIDPKEFADDHIDEFEELVCNRGFLKQHCIRHGDARYCIKEVRQELEGYILADGALDICIEAKFLSVISHPNIIRLCGMSKVSGGDPRTFLILDRLYDTVATRITSWEASVKKMKKGLFGNMKHKQEVKQLWNERLLAMYDIARAVKYLHLNNILHRDIKPENAGFDIHGNVKLFDLGLAKELREKDRIGHDLFKLSGGTGTRRFMSPESVLCLPYGKPSDVYSFAILCWQVLALEKPFNGWNHEKHLNYVVQKGMRPKIPKDWPTLIKYLIEICWSVKPVDRPNFDRICAMLKGDLATSDMSLSNRTESLMDDSLINRELHQMTV